jgi:hypothetical protein
MLILLTRELKRVGRGLSHSHHAIHDAVKYSHTSELRHRHFVMLPSLLSLSFVFAKDRKDVNWRASLSCLVFASHFLQSCIVCYESEGQVVSNVSRLSKEGKKETSMMERESDCFSLIQENNKKTELTVKRSKYDGRPRVKKNSWLRVISRSRNRKKQDSLTSRTH